MNIPLPVIEKTFKIRKNELMEYSPLLNFFIGFISSIGYYRLFFSINRPAVRWQFIAMLIVVIISRPLCVTWQLKYTENAQNVNFSLTVVSMLIDSIALLACTLLGPNRKRAFIASIFIFCVIYSATNVFVDFFMLSFISRLTNSNNAIQTAFLIPQLYYVGICLFNLIVMCHCFLAVRWLRKMPENTPIKLCVIFCLFLLSTSLITLFWTFYAVTQIPPSTFFPFSLLGAMLMSIPLLSLYLFARLASGTKSISANKKESENAERYAHGDYAQFLGQLSKRELEVISAVLAGSLRYKTLASALNISVNTVKTHLQHIYQITGVNNIESLASLFAGYSHDYSQD